MSWLKPRPTKILEAKPTATAARFDEPEPAATNAKPRATSKPVQNQRQQQNRRQHQNQRRHQKATATAARFDEPEPAATNAKPTASAPMPQSRTATVRRRQTDGALKCAATKAKPTAALQKQNRRQHYKSKTNGNIKTCAKPTATAPVKLLPRAVHRGRAIGREGFDGDSGFIGGANHGIAIEEQCSPRINGQRGGVGALHNFDGS